MTNDNQSNDDRTDDEIEFDRIMANIAAGAYDEFQDARVSTMNRVRDIVRKLNEDIPLDKVEDEKDEQDYSRKYKDDNLPGIVEEMADDGTLTVRQYRSINRMLDAASSATDIEHGYSKVMELSTSEPIWKSYLQYVQGIGAPTAAKLIHRFGYCENRDHVSEIWSYSGLAPGQRRRRGESAGFDVNAKTLAWRCAKQMMMCGDRSLYRKEFYIPYKQKQLARMEKAKSMTEAELESVKWTPPNSKQHAHNRAMRYMAKQFLAHYLVIAKDLKGIETPDPWIIEHGGHEKDEESFHDAFYARKVLQERG